MAPKPAKKNTKSFLDGIRKVILDNPTLKQEKLIEISKRVNVPYVEMKSTRQVDGSYILTIKTRRK